MERLPALLRHRGWKLFQISFPALLVELTFHLLSVAIVAAAGRNRPSLIGSASGAAWGRDATPI